MKKIIVMAVALSTLGTSMATRALTQVGETTVAVGVNVSDTFGGVVCESGVHTIQPNLTRPQTLGMVVCTSQSAVETELYIESGNNPGNDGRESYLLSTGGDKILYHLATVAGGVKNNILFTKMVLAGGIDPEAQGKGVKVPANGHVTFIMDYDGDVGTTKPGVYMDLLHVKTFTP